LLNGAVATFEMKLVQVVPAGDHHILIGEITEYINNEDIAPLVFHKGQYRALA
jgi:flavin reductase (DIM6/NTAB) family NADH-FMN oxidoreductase RutF